MSLVFELKLSRNINFEDEIFDSIRKSYDDFPTWSERMKKLNRPCIVAINEKTKQYECIAILKPCEQHRVLKICTFKVHNKFRHKGLGRALMNSIINIVNDDFAPFDKCYITLFLTTDTSSLPKFLERNNFTLTNLRANGEIVYTYERTV